MTNPNRRHTRCALTAAILIAAMCLLMAAPAAAADPGAAPVRFGPKFQDDLKAPVRAVLPDYAKAHPRVVFSATDVAALKKKAADHPQLWANVLKHADGLVKREVPDAKEVSGGAHYWRIEYVESAALAYGVTGDRKYLDAARNWMVQYCKGKIWGEGWGQNVDLHASWYLYHIGIAYDILRDDLADADRTLIRDGLADHARAIYVNFPERYKPGLTYGQNHLYIPVTGMVAGGLAVLDEVPEARQWIKLGQVVMNRARYALGEDGYYFEGFGYWSYALHWHVRYAELMARATGAELCELPILQNDWRFALHMTLPGFPWSYDMGDTGRWAGGKRGGSPSVSQHTHLWHIASRLASPESQLVGDFLNRRGPELDYPAASFIWYDPSVKAASLETVKPYHYFADHDVVSWRSGWDEGATCVLFRCGPSQGHGAAKKLGVLKDWRMNSGHTHPDVGAFWLYAKGTYLAGDTGYTSRKQTADHNTLLVSGKGQGNDANYWYERGQPYEKFNKARIVAVHLADDYAYARGTFGSVYPDDLGRLSLERTLLATRRWVLVIDNLAAEREQTLTWMCHADAEFKAEGKAWVARPGEAALAVFPLVPNNAVAEAKPTIVQAGTGPGKATPQQRGYQLNLTTPAARGGRLMTLLVPLAKGEALPEVTIEKTTRSAVTLKIAWPDAKAETVTCDWKWVPAAGRPGPATIAVE